jgi:hypothetical protein
VAIGEFPDWLVKLDERHHMVWIAGIVALFRCDHQIQQAGSQPALPAASQAEERSLSERVRPRAKTCKAAARDQVRVAGLPV